MMRWTDLFALVGLDVVICAVLLNLIIRWFPAALNAHASGGRFNRRVAGVVVALVCLWIPAGSANLPLLAYVRGIGADLSITSVMLACLALYRQLWHHSRLQSDEWLWLYVAMLLAAAVLYPTALGWGDWDAYRAGWGSWVFLMGLALAALAAFSAGLWLLPLALAAAVLAWTLGLLESGNVWDYLLDPWLVLLACGQLLVASIAFWRRRHAGLQSPSILQRFL